LKTQIFIGTGSLRTEPFV